MKRNILFLIICHIVVCIEAMHPIKTHAIQLHKKYNNHLKQEYFTNASNGVPIVMSVDHIVNSYYSATGRSLMLNTLKTVQNEIKSKEKQSLSQNDMKRVVSVNHQFIQFRFKTLISDYDKRAFPTLFFGSFPVVFGAIGIIDVIGDPSNIGMAGVAGFVNALGFLMVRRSLRLYRDKRIAKDLLIGLENCSEQSYDGLITSCDNDKNSSEIIYNKAIDYIQKHKNNSNTAVCEVLVEELQEDLKAVTAH